MRIPDYRTTAVLALVRYQQANPTKPLNRSATPLVDAASIGVRVGYLAGMRASADALDQAADMERDATRAAVLREAAAASRAAADTEEKRA